LHRTSVMKIFKKSLILLLCLSTLCATGVPLQLSRGVFIMENEIWKDIVGYEGFYQVSNKGNIKSLSRRVREDYVRKEVIMRTPKNNKGYFKVPLRINGKSKKIFVHRAIAICFVSNNENKPHVNHINGIKTDNRIENLEWVTHRENMIHAYTTGLQPKIRNIKKGGESINAKPIEQYDLNGNFIRSFSCAKEAVILFGFNKSGICECARGIRSHHKGFLWKYKTN